jgi:hypothetical protein
MDTYETLTIVEPQGDVRVLHVPFAPGTEVEVTISPKRASAEDFRQAWERICRGLRSTPQLQSISDEEIQREIADYRGGR